MILPALFFLKIALAIWGLSDVLINSMGRIFSNVYLYQIIMLSILNILHFYLSIVLNKAWGGGGVLKKKEKKRGRLYKLLHLTRSAPHLIQTHLYLLTEEALPQVHGPSHRATASLTLSLPSCHV